MAKVTLNVNGSACEVDADPATPLVYVLRNQLGLTGAKLGCALEQCGSCAVLVDGASCLSCVRPVSEFQDSEIVTVEGLADSADGRAVAQAFTEEAAAQCGYCTPGIVVAATALLRHNPAPSDGEIRAALQDHLCRCGAYSRVLRAIGRLTDGGSADAR